MELQTTVWRLSWGHLGAYEAHFWDFYTPPWRQVCLWLEFWRLVLGGLRVKGGKGESLAAEVGPAEGGGGLASELCRGSSYYCLARHATSERGAADLIGYAHCQQPLVYRHWEQIRQLIDQFVFQFHGINRLCCFVAFARL